MTSQQLVSSLIAVAGKTHVLSSAARTRYYRTGFRSGEGEAAAVVFPNSLWVMWQVLQVCVYAGAVIIVQAAKTGLTEGSSPSGYDYDRPVVVINTRKLNQLVLLNSGEQVLAMPGTTLHQVELALKPLGREPHSVIGSSCIGASVVGGIANNSGGALIQRGPAYTELALFAQVDAAGQLQLINHLGIDLGDSPEAILTNLAACPGQMSCPQAAAAASDHEYRLRVRDTDSATPARYNAGPRRLFEASGCAGKIAVFAVRLDSFESQSREQVFYLGSNDAESFTQLRRQVLQSFQQLPVSAEYIHRQAFAVAREYGKDTFLAIDKLGTAFMPRLFAFKGAMTSLTDKIPLLPQELPDKLLYWCARPMPEHLPERLLQFHEQFEHHLIVKVAGEGCDELAQYLPRWQQQFAESSAYFCCSSTEASAAMLQRFAVASAGIRFAQMNSATVEDILALDIALPRNCVNWLEQLPESITQDILPPIYYGHFFCHVFHQDYLVKKGRNLAAVKQKLLAYQHSRGAVYPAEHNVGHLYPAGEQQRDFYQQLDPTNSFNPGIGKMSKRRRYGGYC